MQKAIKFFKNSSLLIVGLEKKRKNEWKMHIDLTPTHNFKEIYYEYQKYCFCFCPSTKPIKYE